MNLFDLIDGLFEGIVFFIYNAVRTAVKVIVRPFRGPRILYRAHRRTKIRQISGHTALFLATFVLTWMVWEMDDLHDRRFADLLGLASSMPTLSGDSLWPFIATALIDVVAIDVILRVSLWIRFPRRHQRRAIAIATIEYAMVAPCLLFGLLLLSTPLIPPLAEHFVLQICLGVFVLFMIVPTVFHIVRGFRPRRSERLAAPWQWSERAFRVMLSVTLFGGVAFGLFATSYEVFNSIIATREQSTAARNIQLVRLECSVASDGGLEAWLALRNGSSVAIAIASADFTLSVGFDVGEDKLIHSIDTLGEIDDGPNFSPQSTSSIRPGALLILDPSASTVLHVQADKPFDDSYGSTACAAGVKSGAYFKLLGGYDSGLPNQLAQRAKIVHAVEERPVAMPSVAPMPAILMPAPAASSEPSTSGN